MVRAGNGVQRFRVLSFVCLARRLLVEHQRPALERPRGPALRRLGHPRVYLQELSWIPATALTRYVCWFLSGTLGGEVVVSLDLIAKG